MTIYCWMILVVKVKRFPKLITALNWAVISLASLIILACQPTAKQAILQGNTMGTTWSIKIAQALTTEQQSALKVEIDSLLQNFNQSVSTYIADSEVNQLNQGEAGQWINLSTNLFHVLESAQHIAQQSEGFFDITVAPLVQLWGFGPGFNADAVPTKQAIQQQLTRIGYRYLELDASGQQIKKQRDNIHIDLSAIAKGQGVDKIFQRLLDKGYHNLMVEIGGEIRVAGHNAENQPWRIAIEQPLIKQRAIQKVLNISDIAVATSGNYRNFFEIDGQRYSHSINPVTGWPVKHELVSVTVLAASAMLADGWATALLVAGPEKALKLAKTNKLAVLLLIQTDNGFIEKTTNAFDQIIIY